MPAYPRKGLTEPAATSLSRRLSSPALRIAAVVAVLLAGTAAGSPLLVSGRAVPPLAPELPWWALAGLFTLIQSCTLNVQIRREARSVALTEIPLILGLLFTVGPGLVLARAVGTALGFGLLRRQYRQPQKLLFNVALGAAEATLAGTLYQLAVPLLQGEPARWIQGVMACALSSGFAAVTVGLVIELVEGSLRIRELARLGLDSVAQAVPVAVVGVVVATAWGGGGLWSAIPLGASGLLLLVAYRAYANLNERHLGLERLYRFTQIVSRDPEVEGILRSVLQQAKELLHAEQARICFVPAQAGAEAVEVVLARNSALTRGPPGFQDPDVTGESVLGPVVVRRNTRVPREREWLERCGLRDSLMVPLPGDVGALAVLAVDDRLGDVRGFDIQDVQLLQTVATSAGMALRNGQLVDQLRHESLHDPLTALPNRTLFARELDVLLAGKSAQVAVGILDVNDFKDINDTLGHHHGDVVLQELARRLSAAAGEQALVARLGGDEFAILLRSCPDPAQAFHFGSRLLDALQEPVLLDGIAVTVSASLGLALAPQHGATGPLLLKRADLAMYDAKQAVRGVRVFEPALDTTSYARLALVTQLRQAVEAGAIDLYLQPQASLLDGELTGAEALARWSHPERGMVSPEEFIPLAERSGIIGPLTELMLDQAIGACTGWQQDRPRVGVSVNISARSLGNGPLYEQVTRLLARHGLAPDLLTLEITESSIMADPANTIGVLERLRAHGVHLSVDDFGTGYSSLSYLRRLPVEEVKIDKSFVQRMLHSSEDAAIVKSIIDLAGSLRLQVVAEGIEDESTWRLLSEMGCDIAQGYLLARPLPLGEMQEWMSRYRPPVPVPAPLRTA